jgi:signal transduction histidine kinase
MADPAQLLSVPEDPKGRLIAIFVGAVLLPSLALSYVSIDFGEKQAHAERDRRVREAEYSLSFIEKELNQAALSKAREAARRLGTDKLLEGRTPVLNVLLSDAGMGAQMFESLHLEASSARLNARTVQPRAEDPDLSRELLGAFDPVGGEEGEDSLPWTGDDGKTAGTLRFKFSCEYVHGQLVRDYFEREFRNPEQAFVVRLAEADGTLIYETAPTPDNRFEVTRHMSKPSFRGLQMFLRYKEASIEQDVNRWKMWTFALIGFIDLMLGAGLFLVYSNVRREMRLSRLKSDFVANVSHELKTPLALIRLFAETLELGRVPGEEKARQYYRVINKESQRLTQLINNILDFSRIEAGRKEYRFAPTDVSRIVQDVVDAYRFQIEQQGFTLEVAIAEDLPEVRADKEALAQAVLNLVNNAIKYSRDEKYLGLELKRQDGRVLLSVSDHGIGIAKGEQDRIFEKFYRAEDSLVHETKGSGLGLSLVHHIMEAHGGGVEVESAPGRGSRFTLALPIREQRPGGEQPVEVP